MTKLKTITLKMNEFGSLELNEAELDTLFVGLEQAEYDFVSDKR